MSFTWPDKPVLDEDRFDLTLNAFLDAAKDNVDTVEGRVTAEEKWSTSQGRGLIAPNPGVARLVFPRLLASGEKPTFTAGIVSASSAISSGVDIDDESAVFRKYGSPVAAAADGYSWIGQAITNATINVGAHWGVEFEWYGAAFELRLRGSATARFRMWVNDLGYDVYAGRSGSMSSDGLLYRHHYDFGSAGLRRIRLEFNGSIQFYGLTIGPTDSIWPPSSPLGPKVVATGDSFTEQFWHWPLYAGWLLGWKDISVVGKGGTGYLDTNAGSDTIRDRAQKDVYNQNPDIVICHAGLNDVLLSAASVQAECNTLFQEIKANTNAVLIVVGFNRSRGLNGDASWIQMRDAIRAAAESHADHYIETVGGPYPYSGTFSDYNTTGWLTGSGRVGATTGSGNCDIFVDTDNTHPTEAGQIYRGFRVAQGIAAAMPILGAS